MPHQVTVTAPTGPGRVVTAGVIPNVTRVDMDLLDKTIQIYTDPITGTNVREFDINGVTTITIAITAGNYAVTLA